MQKCNNLVSRLILFVTVLCLARHLQPLLPVPADWQWYAADVMRAAGMAATLSIVTQLVPWSQLRLKCMAAALCGYYIADTVLCAIWYAWGAFSPVLQAVIQGMAFGSAGLWYAWRSYDERGDTIDGDHVFCLRKKPKSAQDFALSLAGCFGPQGAYAIYAAGTVYHFHHGSLIASRYDQRKFGDYVAVKGRPIQMSHIMALDSIRGVKWSILHNCVTTLGVFWRKHGRK